MFVISNEEFEEGGGGGGGMNNTQREGEVDTHKQTGPDYFVTTAEDIESHPPRCP